MLKLRNRHFFLLDILILLLMPLLAMVLRLDTYQIPTKYLPALIGYTAAATCVRLLVFYFFGIYERYWRFASIEELAIITLAVGASTAALGLGLLLARLIALFPFPRSVVLIDGLLALVLVGGLRFSIRLIEEVSVRSGDPDSQKVLIMGAGDAGQMVSRELLKNPELNMEPIGFVDDDAGKRGTRIHGIKVLGGREDIPYIAQVHGVSRMIIAMPTASGSVIREVVNICENANIETKIIPGIFELLDGTVSVSQIRDVDIEDLLRREPIHTDYDAVKKMLEGKIVLVTGGGGSIGGELCRQICLFHPKLLVILGHGENSIFEIQQEMRLRIESDVSIIPLIADIRSPERIRVVMETFRPEIVFHAAAHKHVPLMEMNPAEAVTNNIIGTENLIKAALEHDVDRFVMISTDKAVNPTSIMGASKRVAELLVIRAARESGNAFVSVRFGNVLGSRGSVLSTFEQQIASGGPVTVTHPEVRRYFMTIPEAVQLVLQASVLGSAGELLIFDMGEPHLIADLARDLIELSGFEAGRDIDIEFVGLRQGEKLFEELFIPGEQYSRTKHEKIFLVGYDGQPYPDDLDSALKELERAALQNDRQMIVGGLKHLVPQFQPADATLAEDCFDWEVTRSGLPEG
jgi:FlaA1/EpsC-like NDP-sugar epimerase